MSESHPQEDPVRRIRHEIRGRMNAIMLCAAALAADASRADQLEFLQHIEEASDAMLVLLDEFEKA